MQGDPGAKGQKGRIGDTGPQGPTGAKGAQGAQGAQGPAGPKGAQGGQGLEGAKGQKGATGAQGAQGNLGPQGPTGSPGSNGAKGAQGAQGATGPQGPTGSTGVDLTSASVITVPAMDSNATTSLTQVYSASTYRLIRTSASFSSNVTFQISNLTQGRFVHLFIQNTNGTARTLFIQGSTTTSGYAAPNFTSVGGGAASSNQVVLAANTGCAYIFITNSLGSIIATIN